MKTTDVRIWAIRQDARNKKASHQVRWKVGEKPFSSTFRTKALADSYRAKLVRATRDGEEFDTETGLPGSMEEKAPSVSWFDFAKRYAAMKWPHAAPNSRDSISETLTLVTTALLGKRRGRPSDGDLRTALRRWAFVVSEDESSPPDQAENVLHWVAKASLPLSALRDTATARGVLDALKLKLDGTPAAAETVRRKRNVLVNALRYAVEIGELPENPLSAVRWQKPKVAKQVDPRVVVNPCQARQLLAAVSYVGSFDRARGRRLMAMFACMYYGALRPAEAVGLRLADCILPENGWGRLLLHQTRPTAGKRWTGNGQVHDDRGLKNRAEQETRPVPIPPHLVTVLRHHLKEFGTAEDGRLFFNERKTVLSSSTYSRVWEEARRLALSPEQVASPLAGRPYDLRHAALSTWLNAGVDPTEVAERAGNSVEVLFSRYAKCLDGRQGIANRRIEKLLGGD